MSNYPRLDPDGLATMLNRLAQVVKINSVTDIKDVSLNNLQGGQVLKYDSVLQKWVNRNDESGGGGLKIGDVSGATATTTAGTRSVSLAWTDPTDVEVSGVALAEWAGTLVVRKAGSAPTNKDDGTLIVDSKTRNQYASTGYVDSAVDYGTTYYYRFFPYTTGGLYTDGSSVNALPSKALVAIPEPTGDLTYNGVTQTMPFNYDNTKVTLGGNVATDAGEHTAVAHLIDTTGCEWSDHTTEDKYIEWTIKRAKVTEPTVTGSFTYDGTEKTANVSTYDNTIISVTGITGTNAGTYTATLSIIDYNYQWTDDTTEDKTENWTIAKGVGGCTVTPDSITLDSDHLTGTVVISNPTGTITGVTSTVPASVSATLSGDTITVTALDSLSQTVNVEIEVASSANYESATVILPVICSFLKIVEWADGTDAEIAAMLEAHYAGSINIYDYWEVGDERVVSLSAMSATGVGESHVAQNVKMVLMNKGGKTLTTPINGHNECAFIVGQKNMLANGTTREGGYMNSSNTNSGGWNNCARRTWCNSVYKNALPSTLVGIFKEHQNVTANGSGSTTATSSDYFALPSEKEVFGSVTYANATAEANNTQFKYYETSSNRIKYQGETGGSAHTWWERSPYSGNTAYFCGVTSSGNASGTTASRTYGLVPFGCI